MSVPKYNFKDLTGQRFNRLVVQARSENDKHGNAKWICLCDCGGKRITSGVQLRRGECQSCGCYHKDSARAVCLKRTKHGEARLGNTTKEYTTWTAMKSRCLYKKNKFYHYYGGRGIKVCDRWLDSFENFLTDLGRRPSDQHSLDRVDPNGNYEPSNCKWSTDQEQNRNKRYEQILHELVRVKGLLDKYVDRYGELKDAS